jgi:hypothetical protein
MKKSPTRDLQPIPLLEPVFDRCLTVFEALKIRRTSRAIGDRKIPLQILSDILWAAQGINRVKGQGPFGGPRKDCGIGQQFAGDLHLCHHGGRAVSVRT